MTGLMSSISYSAPIAAVVTTVKGSVEVYPVSMGKWQTAKTGLFLYEGDTVKTGKDAQAALTFTNGTVLKLNRNTEFTIENTGQIEKIGTQIQMKLGSLWSKVIPRSRFEIRTPVAVVAVRGTEFETNLLGGRLDVSVFSGTVNLKNKYGEVNVEAGNKSAVSGENPPEPPAGLNNYNPTWQEGVISQGTLKLEQKTATPVAGQQIEMRVTAYDLNGQANTGFSEQITAKSDTPAVLFSPDGRVWNRECQVSAVNGTSVFYVKAAPAGKYTIVASATGVSAATIDINVSAPAKKALKVKVKNDTGAEEELLLKFRKK
jgi:hypothetical protein